MDCPLDDKNADRFEVWFVDDSTRNVLWQSSTNRNPFKIKIGEEIKHNGASYFVKRVHGPENGTITIIV